jgi:hypothetical protein
MNPKFEQVFGPVLTKAQLQQCDHTARAWQAWLDGSGPAPTERQRKADQRTGREVKAGRYRTAPHVLPGFSVIASAPMHEQAAYKLKALAQQSAADPRPPQHGMDADYLGWVQREERRQAKRRKWEEYLP